MFQGRVGERDGSCLASVKCVSVFSFSASIVHIPMSVESDTKFWLGYLFFFYLLDLLIWMTYAEIKKSCPYKPD